MASKSSAVFGAAAPGAVGAGRVGAGGRGSHGAVGSSFASSSAAGGGIDFGAFARERVAAIYEQHAEHGSHGNPTMGASLAAAVAATADAFAASIGLNITAPSIGYKRKRKDPWAPKKPQTAYLFFLQEESARLRNENLPRRMSVSEVSAAVAETWRRMTEEQRNKYEEMAERDRNRYESEVLAYRARFPKTRP